MPAKKTSGLAAASRVCQRHAEDAFSRLQASLDARPGRSLTVWPPFKHTAQTEEGNIEHGSCRVYIEDPDFVIIVHVVNEGTGKDQAIDVGYGHKDGKNGPLYYFNTAPYPVKYCPKL